MNPLILRRYLRLTPFDSETEQGRTDERYRRAAWSVLANVASRGMAMVVMVLSVSLTIPYLGAERFGVWMTISSFAGMLTFLDLGVGNALTNHVARTASHDDSAALQRTISGGLGFLFLLSIGIGTGLTLLASLLPWTSIIKANNPALHGEIRQACMLFAALYGLNLFTSGIQKVFVGLQQAFTGHLVATTGSIMAVLLLWWAASQQAEIPTLLSITLGCQSFSGLLLLLLLTKRRLFILKGISAAIQAEQHPLLHTGGLFFILQIGTMVGWGADSLIISSTLGATQVAIYSVTQRLFQFVSQPLAMINAPLWGAYADALARNEKKFIRSTLKKSIITTTFTATIGGVLFIIYGSQIIAKWTNDTIISSNLTLLLFFAWTTIETTGNAFAVFLNGCSIMKIQVQAVLIFSALAIPSKLALTNFGLHYLIAATIVSYIIAVPVFYSITARSKIKEALK